MVASSGCSPSAPRLVAPGCPYKAIIRRPGNPTWPPPGSSTPVAAVSIRLRTTSAAPNALPTASTVDGGAAANALIASPLVRGSGPDIVRMRAPAAFAVASAAVLAAPAPPITNRLGSGGGRGGHCGGGLWPPRDRRGRRRLWLRHRATRGQQDDDQRGQGCAAPGHAGHRPQLGMGVFRSNRR